MRTSPFRLLLFAVLALSAFPAVYAYHGVDFSGGIAQLSSVGFTLALLAWMEDDARRRHCLPCHDFGFLCGVFLPLSVVWYAVWTRGWRGLGLLVALFALLLLPSLAALATAAFGGAG